MANFIVLILEKEKLKREKLNNYEKVN